MIRPTIYRGDDFSVILQSTSEPYEEGLLIRTSSAANPAVVTTDLPHQLQSGNRVRISGHRKNTIINGKQTVTVIDVFNFSVPVAGACIGTFTGRVSKAIDITAYVFTPHTKISRKSAALAGCDPVVTPIVLSDGDYTVTLTKDQTPLIIPNACFLEINFVDGNGKRGVILVECEVRDA